jgi:hypothetical protein
MTETTKYSKEIFNYIFTPPYIDDVKNIRGINNYISFDIKKDKITNFYPLEQLYLFDKKDLKKLIETRKIKISNYEKYKIIEKIFQWQIEYRIRNNNYECKNIEDVYKYYKGSGYLDINNFLREKIIPNNIYPLIAGKYIQKLNFIFKLDNYISEYGNNGDNSFYVYRGITPPELIVLERCLKLNKKKVNKEGLAFNYPFVDRAFVSASKNIEVAAGFVERNECNCCVLKFRLPKNIKYLDIDYDSDEKEVIIQRNVSFTEFKTFTLYKNKVMIIECKIQLLPSDIDSFYNDTKIFERIKKQKYYNYMAKVDF